MTNPLTNEEVDNSVRAAGNWDVNKVHMRKFRDEINEHFGHYWFGHLPPCQDGVSDAWGISIVQTVPELTRNYLEPASGRYITKHYTGSGHACDFVSMGHYFSFEQRFIVDREASPHDEGFTIALRCLGSWSPNTSSYCPRRWTIHVEALKLLNCATRSEELAAHARVRAFLAMLRLES